MRALLYPPLPDLLYLPALLHPQALPPASFCRPLGEHYVQALVMRVSFFWGSFRGSPGERLIFLSYW